MSWYVLSHSAKGSTWEKHKYLRVINGKYYYPDSYEGGRHLSNVTGKKKAISGQKLTMERKLNVTKKSGTKIKNTQKTVQQETAQQTPQMDPAVVNNVKNQILQLFRTTMKKNPGHIVQDGKSPYTAFMNKEVSRDGKTPQTAKLQQKPKTNKKRLAKTIIRQDASGNEISRTVNGITKTVTKKSPGNLTPADKANINKALVEAKKKATNTSGASSATVNAIVSAIKKKLK